MTRFDVLTCVLGIALLVGWSPCGA